MEKEEGMRTLLLPCLKPMHTIALKYNQSECKF